MKVNEILKRNSELNTPYNLAAYTEISEQTIENPDLNRYSEAVVMIAQGNLELIFKRDIYFNKTDDNGCIISQGIAKKLFGNNKVIGEEICYDNKFYFVRGVLSDYDNDIFIIRPHEKMETYFNTFLVQRSEETFSITAIKEQISNCLEVEGKIVDYNFMIEINGVFFSVPFLVLIIKGLLAFRCRYANYNYFQPTKIKLSMTYVSNILLLIIVLFYFSYIKSLLCYPVDYIPSSWADFAFWAELFQSKIDAMVDFARMPKGYYEMQFCKSVLDLYYLYLPLVFMTSIIKKELIIGHGNLVA